MATQIRFDDLDALNRRAGEFGPWGPEVEVTQDMIDRFADLTGDHQWIHVDVDRARRDSPFGGPVAHGFLTLSLIPRVVDESTIEIVGHHNGANYGADKLRFMAPVPAGSRIHGRTRLLKAEERPRGTLLTTEIEIAVIGAERPALVYAMQVLYMGATGAD
jgi:acyl dehydratase